ncbi:Eco57I restriction-modification methylase domain-containing protein [Aurantimicrobium minutum]|uniref:site-specific DNA-methyltransferase (adenine-specific) n=1 Tax=Aurantimicrobium minutum TaxID=708131 RepID=A0A173LXL3_9MICO|nr:DNA methyltransferase [Aurantimicrobium minutum]BAU99695.1 putative type II restriction enzyme [Aurantimicrobium minutum]
MASDAFIVGEGWLSEHFFTTDAKSQSFQALVAARRKEWDELETDGHGTARSRFSAFRAQLEGQLAELQPGSSDLEIEETLYQPLREVLGFVGGSFTLEKTGPVTRVSTPGIVDGAPLVLIDARPVDALEDLLLKDEPTLLVPFSLDENDNHDIHSVARLLSTLFIEEEGPSYALVFAGKWMLIAEKERWPEGRYLAVDLQLVAQRNDQKKAGEVDRALTCISSDSLGPDAEGDIWWNSVLEEAIKHTVGVSQDLREGVRLSIEIIANDVVQRRRRAGLTPLPGDEAQNLAKQSLRFLYRILFLLFAEASPELKVLPVGASEYEEGYSLDRLRELTLVPLVTETAENGTHFYQSLAVLFNLVDKGHGAPSSEEESVLPEGLVFNGLKADLFLPKATLLIDEVMLSDSALQQVLTHLLLSKEQKGKDRGFISYADLGINQLGAVYEGLMSYTGFFAETPLYEVAKDGDASKGSWVVPTDRAQGLDPKDFVKRTNPITGEVQPVIHEQGSFVFRLAGRERQQSASYYTPEVLTRFTVSQALEELLDQDGTTTTAEEILKLTVCEPALGSGAFAIEAVRQLAEEYLRRRQDELGERIAPEDYPQELQKVKAYIALHNVYGVDLNATAVELAEITLWLETMSDGLDAPWFGLHLRRGNSLVGARMQTFSTAEVKDRSKQKSPSKYEYSFDSDALFSDTGIFQFLLPATGWGSSAEIKDFDLDVVENISKMRTWRRRITSKLTASQLTSLQQLSIRTKELYSFTVLRLDIAETQVRRTIPIWGNYSNDEISSLTRAEIQDRLNYLDGAYQRLRLVMDAWCSLWFWPLEATDTVDDFPPDIEEWISFLTDVLGKSNSPRKQHANKQQEEITSAASWSDLNLREELNLSFAGAVDRAELLARHKWLFRAISISEAQGFFHWDLDFANIMVQGGFDLQIGNPPWVRPQIDIEALLAEGDPWWQLKAKSTKAEETIRRQYCLAIPSVFELVSSGIQDQFCTASFLSAAANYELLSGLTPDLYRCFMQRTWEHSAQTGIVALIHPDTHFTDDNGGFLRKNTYRRLRRHWQFENALGLFEIGVTRAYGVHVYGTAKPEIEFLHAVSLYHPETVVRSLVHDGSGPEPGLKNDEGKWDLRPHASRIQRVDESTLGIWKSILGTDEPATQVKIVNAVTNSISEVLSKLAATPRISSLNAQFCRGWNETTDKKAGIFDVSWGRVESWDEAILHGPHLFGMNPFYKFPNPSMKNKQDWSLNNLENLDSEELPITSYKRQVSKEAFESHYPTWDGVPSQNYFRIAWRNMAANMGERTLIPAIIPPGATHVLSVYSMGLPKFPLSDLLAVAGQMSTLIADFFVRSVPKSNILSGTASRLPVRLDHPINKLIQLRVLRLNCLTSAYKPLWEEAFDDAYLADSWAGGLDYFNRPRLAEVSSEWTRDSAIRRSSDRRQLLLEIDVLTAMLFGLSCDELCAIYRTQFPVLSNYDRNTYFYDLNGRLVPNSLLSEWRDRGDKIDQISLNQQVGNTSQTFELPFINFNRIEDFQAVWDEFALRLGQ